MYEYEMIREEGRGERKKISNYFLKKENKILLTLYNKVILALFFSIVEATFLEIYLPHFSHWHSEKVQSR